VITHGIRAFMARDWAAVRASKDRYWRERVGRLGALEGLRVADELRRQVMHQCPDWPRTGRDEDLQCHVRLARLFRRAGSARRA
jgi:hypothetical protein